MAHHETPIPATHMTVGHVEHSGTTAPKWHAAISSIHSSSSTNSLSTSLNLCSTNANLAAGLLGNFGNITIEVGGKSDNVKMNSQLTDAELVAAQQVLSGGHQTITIGTSGAASGGNITVNLLTTGNALTTPTGFATGGRVILNLQGPNILVANNAASAGQIKFDENNTVLADPPGGAAVLLPTSTGPLLATAGPTASTIAPPLISAADVLSKSVSPSAEALSASQNKVLKGGLSKASLRRRVPSFTRSFRRAPCSLPLARYNTFHTICQCACGQRLGSFSAQPAPGLQSQSLHRRI